jgi:D-glycero-D-manno-heptose 1,7-bisphosphate phosphatase
MGDRQVMKKAVFLDRDGVLNEQIFNPDTNEYEPPHRPEDVKLYPSTIPCLRKLHGAGYELFLISNQPDYAKGKVTLESLEEVNKKFLFILSSERISFRDFYYCFDHPNGIVKEYSFVCECRKPEPYFLLKAQKDHSIDLAESWMVGDRDTDIECGRAARVRTILINDPHSADKRGKSNPDFTVKDLSEATKIILSYSH